MSRFILIAIEKEETESFPDYGSLDIDREFEYRVLELSQDQYGNRSSRILISCINITYAKRFLRSCRLIEGIEIE